MNYDGNGTCFHVSQISSFLDMDEEFSNCIFLHRIAHRPTALTLGGFVGIDRGTAATISSSRK